MVSDAFSIPEWHEQGACRSIDPELWFQEVSNQWDMAFKFCHTCPVQRECLRQSFDNREEFGIWGGLGQGEREHLLPKFIKQTIADRDGWIDRLLTKIRDKNDALAEQKQATKERLAAKKKRNRAGEYARRNARKTAERRKAKAA